MSEQQTPQRPATRPAVSNPAARPATGATRPAAAGTARPAAGTTRPAGTRPAAAGTARPATAGARPAAGAARPAGTRPAQRPPVKKKKKKKNNSGALLILLLAVILIVALIIIVPKLGGKKPVDPQTTDPVNTVQTETVTPAPKANATLRPITIKSLNTTDLGVNEALNGTWRSVLMVGTDARLWDDMKHTDTMIIACYNQKTGAIRLVSVMRDAFIDISDAKPDKGTVRLNTVSSYGGMELLIKKLNQKLGLNITEYVLVDFAGFVDVIDILGGIDVDITEVEKEYINSGLIEQINLLVEKGGRESTLKRCTLDTYGPGIHLNGLQSLAYARIRKSDSDYKRTERQRTVITAAAQKAIDTVSIAQASQIIQTAMQYVETNMPVSSIVQLGVSVLNTGIDDIKDTRIPINNSFTGETRKNVWGMYDIDWQANYNEVQMLLNGY